MIEIKRASAQITVDRLIERYIDVPKFLSACQSSPNYGKVWSCPPYDFDPVEYLKGYKILDLAGVQVRTGAGEDAGMAFERASDALGDALLKDESSAPDRMALLAGKCRWCKSCTRGAGEACRHPDRMRYSIESLGGDVTGIADELLSMPITWQTDPTAPAILTLVGGILRK